MITRGQIITHGYYKLEIVGFVIGYSTEQHADPIRHRAEESVAGYNRLATMHIIPMSPLTHQIVRKELMEKHKNETWASLGFIIGDTRGAPPIERNSKRGSTNNVAVGRIHILLGAQAQKSVVEEEDAERIT